MCVCVCVCVRVRVWVGALFRACACCSLTYSACKAHAPYYIFICGVSGSIFFDVNGTIFQKHLLKIKCVFWFSQVLFQTLLILRIIQRDIIRTVTAELFHEDWQPDRRTDIHDKANSRYSQFWERVKNSLRVSASKVIVRRNCYKTGGVIYACGNTEALSRIVVAVCACVRACAYPGVWACACAYLHVALLIQHATRMLNILTSFVAPWSPPHFSTLSHKRCDFRKKVIEHKTCVLIFSTNVV